MATEDTQSLSSDQKELNHPSNDHMEKISEQLRRQGYIVTEEYSNVGLSKVSGESPPENPRLGKFSLISQGISALATPLTIIGAIIGLLVSVNQFKTQQMNSAQMQATQVAASAAQELDQQRQATLDTYAAVRNLDGNRKGILVRFLLTAGLISVSKPMISMSDADLSGAKFTNADLSAFS